MTICPTSPILLCQEPLAECGINWGNNSGMMFHDCGGNTSMELSWKFLIRLFCPHPLFLLFHHLFSLIFMTPSPLRPLPLSQSCHGNIVKTRWRASIWSSRCFRFCFSSDIHAVLVASFRSLASMRIFHGHAAKMEFDKKLREEGQVTVDEYALEGSLFGASVGAKIRFHGNILSHYRKRVTYLK